MASFPLNEAYLFDEENEVQERLRPFELLKLEPRILLLKDETQLYRFLFTDQEFNSHFNSFQGYAIEVVIMDSRIYKIYIFHGIFENGELLRGQIIKIPGPLSLAPEMTDQEITSHEIIKDFSQSSNFGIKN